MSIENTSMTQVFAPRVQTQAKSQSLKRLSVQSRLATSLLALLAVGGCAAFPAMTTSNTRPLTDRNEEASELLIDGNADADAIGVARGNKTSSLSIPSAAENAPPSRQPADESQINRLVPEGWVDATVTPQTIPQFVSTVFGGLINVPFILGPDVASRTEVIAGGSGGPIEKRALFEVAQQALKQYGIDVYIDGNTVNVGATSPAGQAPVISRQKNTADTAGRVVHFYTAKTIEATALQTLLQDMYPNLRSARISVNQQHNTLTITGSGREVAQVVNALTQIDLPRFAGSEVMRIEPSFWNSDALAGALEQTLNTEGYLVSRTPSIGRGIILLSFPAANQILVFATDPALLERVRYWVNAMDQPASLGDKASMFIYQVRNTDAQSLGQLAMGQSQATSGPRTPTGVPGAPPQSLQGQENSGLRQGNMGQAGQGGQFMGGRLLIDSIGNRIIFNGTASDYAQLRTLLTTLDTPAPQVVIEVIIAEVTLTDNTSLGVQLFGTDERGDGLLTGSTEAIDLPGGGLLMTFNGPDFRARLNASAANSRVNILQRPQLVARSGGTARFQVGTDVPIITSQRATTTQTGSDGTDILQSIQYRQTGVILELEPVVYGDRVDINISQEISEVGKSSNPAIASPPILSRSLNTQIALTDGWTGVLGGLISNNYSKANSGVPFLKDLPVVGSAFQNNSVTGARTELLILITPTIVRGDEDMADLADRYAADMNAAFRTGRGWSYTLTPFNMGFEMRGVGFDLPRPGRHSEVMADREARRAAKDLEREAREGNEASLKEDLSTDQTTPPQTH